MKSPPYSTPKEVGRCIVVVDRAGRKHQGIGGAAPRRAGIDAPVSPHWLRHAHASHCLDRGAPILLGKETLGHLSIATTGKYLRARPSDSVAMYLPI